MYVEKKFFVTSLGLSPSLLSSFMYLVSSSDYPNSFKIVKSPDVFRLYIIEC